MTFRYTHDLEILIVTLTQQGIDVPQKVKECAFLSVFAWETRYPGFEDSVTIEEYQNVIHKAEIVVAWAEKVLES
ncbi:MAG: HEPN domain-containing protein [Magnetococcales bacterium]|nr:HEPN domain-containing protein [Magnetococcales bacterium]